MPNKNYKIRCTLSLELNKKPKSDKIWSFLILSIILLLIIILFGMLFSSCKKFIQVDSPTSSITTNQVFDDSADANTAIMGLYAKMINTGQATFASGGITIYAGLSGDELINYEKDDNNLMQIYTNSLLPVNGLIYSNLWQVAYPIIYQANACIEGLQATKNIRQSIKDPFIGEAKFIRSLCYFYLINLFGDVPYIATTDWTESSLAKRTPQEEIYQNIIKDLKDAQTLLPVDYSFSNGERTRANKWAATALLARVYLFLHDNENAQKEATTVIDNASIYGLVTDLQNVFLKNSEEAILQFGLTPNSPIANVTPEGSTLIPYSNTSRPYYYLSTQLIGSFEPGDKRKIFWLDTTIYQGVKYYYPYKYKNGNAQYNGGMATEYYMVLRLAEQYLIRAEAKLNSDINGAVNDLNTIRVRAGLPKYTGSVDPDSVLNAIMQERRIELFSEWGHRWLDLKRTGQLDTVMTSVTPSKNGGNIWHTYQQLYPIPLSEQKLDPNLTQNPGYQ